MTVASLDARAAGRNHDSLDVIASRHRHEGSRLDVPAFHLGL